MESLQLIHRDTYLICQMDHGKVNAIDTLLCEELDQVFAEAESNPEIKGLILTGKPHCFSAGINVIKLMSGGPAGQEAFIRAYISLLQRMTRFSKPYLAALTGFSPAGGCVMACTADYRIMGRGEKHTIGMHEMSFHMLIPEVMCDLYSFWIGKKTALDYVFNSRLMQADEAVEIGLVNEACEVEEVLPLAEARMQEWVKTYPPILRKTKSYLKKDLVRKMDFDLDTALEAIMEDWKNPEYVQQVAAFAMSLKNKKKE